MGRCARAKKDHETNRGGQFLRLLRRESGLSQKQLARNAAPCSEGSIRKFEQGAQPIRNTPLTERLAQSLGTFTIELLLADSDLENESGCVNRFKLALTSHTVRTSSSSRVTTRQVRGLETRVDKALAFAASGAYRELSVILPRLINNLNAVRGQTTNGRTVKTALRLLAEVYLATSGVMNELHEHDVAVIAADRVIVAGEEWGNEVPGKCLVLRGQVAKARSLLDSGYPNRARDVLGDGIALYKEIEQLNDSEQVNAVGSWLLLRAELDARCGNDIGVKTKLEDARKLAQRASGARNNKEQTFTTTVVAMAALRLSLEIGDGTLALKYLRDVVLISLRSEQQARVLIDVARAYILVDSPEKALRMLLKAEKLAPQELGRGDVFTTIVEIQSHVGEPHASTLCSLVSRLYR